MSIISGTDCEKIQEKHSVDEKVVFSVRFASSLDMELREKSRITSDI